MHRSCFLIFLLTISLTTVIRAQATRNVDDIDLSNIFNTRYTHIGIPIKDSVYIYRPPSSTGPNIWSAIASLAMPKGTIAMDGNIRKNIFLTKERVIFEEQGRYDTLYFSNMLPPITPRLWIRSPHSTEVDSYLLSGEKKICYYKEYNENENRFVWQMSDQLSPYVYKENRTQPVLTDSDGFLRLYSFEPGDGGVYIAALFDEQISFYRYPAVQDTLLGNEIVAPPELSFDLPQGCITAFIYDYKYIAVVSQEQIDFYDFNRTENVWVKAEGIPSLRLSSLNKHKK